MQVNDNDEQILNHTSDVQINNNEEDIGNCDYTTLVLIVYNFIDY